MKKSIITIVSLFVVSLISINANEDALCNVVPYFDYSSNMASFQVTLDGEPISMPTDHEIAIRIACSMEKNGECSFGACYLTGY